MSITERAARLIDPGAFEGWISAIELSKVESARIRYRQSKALCIAGQILKLACQHPDLKRELIGQELDGWRKLGLSMGDEDLQKAVASKYRGE